ncbi:PREDICTED: pentatricopeptide repeat-containing protein At5g66520 [Tarenaya hassleriana]|uniref:pentatricopeptide repeat-containing protein At5g66520 n=1 Tax=Tarenaya hassleriana TaxID=28532 RepID=UPI00053C7B2E|nr:PREDICTED: pentatricopeptide repeat-containing protein At5g66520 [Tarenaya hassleriana]
MAAVTTSVASMDRSFLEHNLSDTMSCLRQCSNTQELKQIHARMLKTGLMQDSSAVSKFLSFCLFKNPPCFLPYAQMVFDSLHHPDTFLWNLMIRGFSSSNEPERSILLYRQMLCRSAPLNVYTFPFLLKACSNESAFGETKQIHAQIIKFGYAGDVYATNSMINAYAVTGNVQFAHRLFDRSPLRDIVSWNSMIKGYAKVGKMGIALKFFQNMPEKNVISWTTLISGYVQAGMNKEALDLFRGMQNADVEPDHVSLANVISACAQLGALEQGKWIHAYVSKRSIRLDSVLGCVLIDMYAKCGEMEEALSVFRKMKKDSVQAWTAVISGFACNGNGRAALSQFMEMQNMGIEPNEITFTAVLTACSYNGLVGEGKLLFRSMERSYNLKPTIEHYGCMVDLLGRAGRIDEAKELIENMPLKPNAVIWGALLKACQIHKNVELGERIGEILMRMDPHHGGRYVHTANLYAMARKWDRAVETRRRMKDQGALKVPGRSTISVDGTVHVFFAGDRSHPEIEGIHSKWKAIRAKLGEKGYMAEAEDMRIDLLEEEREVEMAMEQHSERLAIAYGMMKSKAGSTLRIVKNLRVCKDCHTVTKLISKIYQRDIVMRDRIRFHHFSDGKCSCGDYW